MAKQLCFSRILVVMACLFFMYNVNAQNIVTRYLNHTLRDTSNPANPKFIAYPTISYSPETLFEFGISGLLVYRAKRDTINRLSEMQGFGFVTQEGQYGAWLEHALYTDKDRCFFLGQAKFQNFPLSYHGIGMNTPEKKIALVSTTELKIKERVLRQVRSSLFTGFEVNFERQANVVFDAEPNQLLNLPLGHAGSSNLSFGWGVVYNDIHNVLNPRHGHFGEIAFLSSRQAWGSTFDFNLAFADLRYYVPMGEKNVLALQVVGQFGNGNIPFNQLALMGGERMMRGYYLGRYRDNNYTAAQVEYRMLPFSFAKRWGGSVFASAGAVYPDFQSLKSSPFAWAIGGGPRFLLFPKKDVYNRIDVAFTPEGYGIYFLIGEAF
ncbi:outer membrane protein assembly factor [Bacteroidia bacterium]|nr:outer membrane protein assembly factor [Bacteroidia bacterium]